MNKTLKTSLIAATVLASGLAIASPYGGAGRGEGPCQTGPYQAMHGGRFGVGGERMLERMSEKLDLSTEQREAVRGIIDEARPAQRELREAMQSNRQALHALSVGDDGGDAAVRTLAEKQGDYLAEMIVLRNRMKSDIATVLTAEQREQWKALREEHRARRGHFGKGF